MNCQELLDTLQKENQTLLEQVEAVLSSLDEGQWTWRPNPQAWNALETLEHLNLVLERAFNQINQELDKSIDQGLAPTDSYQVGWIGELAVQLMDTNEERRGGLRFKTSKEFNPIDRPLNTNKVLKEFIMLLKLYHQIMERARLVPLGKIRIKLLGGSFVRFRLGDTLRFFSAHTSRHFVQIRRIINHEEFPADVKSSDKA